MNLLVNYKEVSEDAAFLKKGGTQKLLLFRQRFIAKRPLILLR
ncbi:hypothetical protein [Acetobacter musti]|nr:hypothetical protein [Acetobacter musti]